MNDPKYKFGADDQLFHRIGEYFIDKNEPVMVLRGKDVTSLAAICGYVNALLDMSENEIVNSHLDSSLERLKTFYEYQTTSGVAGVGCSQKHHSNSEQYIKKTELLLTELRLIKGQNK
jgi:hypothetical protein